MFGCSVAGGLNPVITGTRGVNQTAVRTDVGVVELTLDVSMAPHEYAANVSISELIGDGSFVPTKTLAGSTAKVVVRTYAGGVAADLDFDLIVFPYNSSNTL